MTILGIDPGSRTTGYGVVLKRPGGFDLVSAGVVRLDRIDDFNDRLLQLHEAVCALITEFSPACLSIERAFMGKNVASAFKLGAARAACIISAKRASIPVFEYTAREVKMGIAGSGAAEKADVQKAVRWLLRLPQSGRLQADAADAIAIAMHHGNCARFDRPGAR